MDIEFYMAMLSALLLALLIGAVLLYQFSPRPILIRNVTLPTERIKACIQIIGAKSGPHGEDNIISQHDSRMIANRRLVDGFGIDNVFTTPDPCRARDFVEKAKMLMNNLSWGEIAALTREDIGSFLAIAPVDGIHLTSLVQIVSLSTAFRAFLGDFMSSRSLPQASLLVISNMINEIWIESKLPGDRIPYHERHALHKALRDICPGLNPLNPQENPLNWLLPSFETLWRIVLRAFIQIKYSAGNSHPQWRLALIQFSSNPTKVQFEESFKSQTFHSQGSSVSVQDIISEALRLYPPTRHIHRAVQYDGTRATRSHPVSEAIAAAANWISTRIANIRGVEQSHPPPQIVIADIESLHIDEEIWGTDAFSFKPERRNNLSAIQRKAFMPFGNKPFLCPARPVFGPRAIALLVGLLLDAFKGEQWYLDNDSQLMSDLDSGDRLSLRRDSYNKVLLRRRTD